MSAAYVIDRADRVCYPLVSTIPTRGIPMRVGDVMTHYPVRIRLTSNLHHAAELVALSGVSDLMVVDEDNTFVGVLSEGDILRAALPDIDEILTAGGSLDDAFDLFLRKGANLSDRPILPLVIREPLTVDPDD